MSIVGVDETIDSMINSAIVLVGDLKSQRKETPEFYCNSYSSINLLVKDSGGPVCEPFLHGGCLPTQGRTLVTADSVGVLAHSEVVEKVWRGSESTGEGGRATRKLKERP
jgi:hypothetical protein